MSFIDRLMYFGLPLTSSHGLTLPEKVTCIKIIVHLKICTDFTVDSTLHLQQCHSGIFMLTNLDLWICIVEY